KLSNRLRRRDPHGGQAQANTLLPQKSALANCPIGCADGHPHGGQARAVIFIQPSLCTSAPGTHTGTLHFRLSIIEKREKSLPAIQYFSIHRLRMCAIIFIFLLVQVWLLLPFVVPVFRHASFSLRPSSAGDGPCNQQQCLSIF